MGQVIQVNGDYNIKAKIGSTITLDTGAAVGSTVVTGNLVVQGTTLTVSTEELQIKDNIIVLNQGETGAGVTLRYSGIEVDRGTDDNVLFVFDENDNTWNFYTRTDGVYETTDASIRVTSIKSNPDDASGGDLNLIGTGTGVVNVTGTTAYELRVIEYGDDAIPNKKYVDDAIQGSPSRQIRDDDTRILIADIDAIATGGGLNKDGDPVLETEIAVVVDNVTNTVFYANRVLVQGLEFNGTEIANNDTSSNIYLRTTGTGKLQTNYALQLEQIGTGPLPSAGNSFIYAQIPSTGDSGVYFSAGSRSGELISKDRALLYSMLF